MAIVAAWTVDSPGWTADYRVVERRTWLWPVRLNGHWYRGPYADLQVMYAEENPPTGWLTVGRSVHADALLPGGRTHGVTMVSVSR